MILKTFWQALMMTLRGEQPVRRHGKLSDWIATTAQISDQFIQQAEIEKLELSTFSAKVDGRTQTLKTIIYAVNYHAKTEFTYLLKHLTEHSITAIYATNMNDAYAVKRILEDEGLKAGMGAGQYQLLQTLSKHLDAIPPSQDLAG